MRKFEKYYGWIVAFVFCVAVIAVYKTFDNFNNITKYVGTVLGALKPFLTAFIIAYILNMPAKRMQNFMNKSKNNFLNTHSRGISIFIIYILALVLVVVILYMLIPALYRNVMDLYNNLPTYITNLQEYLNGFELVRRIAPLGDGSIDLYGEINKVFMSIDMAQFGKYAQGVFDVTSGLFDIFVAVIASVYMLLDKERLQHGIIRVMGIFFKAPTVSKIAHHAKRINDIFTNYIYSRLTCCVIMAFVCSIVLMVMKVRYALILGLFIGAMDMIPYFGSIISFALSTVVTFITGGLWKGVWTAVVLLVLQQLDGNLLGPKVMGDSLEIRPLWIIFAVSVGGTLFGFLGMLFSVPVIAIIKAVISDYFSERELKQRVGNVSGENTDEKK